MEISLFPLFSPVQFRWLRPKAALGLSWLSSIERSGRGDHAASNRTGHEIHENCQIKVIHRFRRFSRIRYISASLQSVKICEICGSFRSSLIRVNRRIRDLLPQLRFTMFEKFKLRISGKTSGAKNKRLVDVKPLCRLILDFLPQIFCHPVRSRNPQPNQDYALLSVLLRVVRLLRRLPTRHFCKPP
jgi:hypothetical protein